MKFGLPMASSATMLLYGLEFLKEGYDYAGQFGMGLRQVRWALEYFRKCYVDKDRFYAQVCILYNTYPVCNLMARVEILFIVSGWNSGHNHSCGF